MSIRKVRRSDRTSEPGVAACTVTCERCGSTTSLASAPRDDLNRVLCTQCPARVLRVLRLAPELHHVLARLGELVAPKASFTIAAASLHKTEAAIGSVIPDAILALYAAQGRSLDAVVRLTTELARREGNPRGSRSGRHGLIVADAFGAYPRVSIGFRPTQDRGEPEIIAWDWKTRSVLPRGVHGTTWQQYVLHRFVAPPDDDVAPLDLRTAPSEAALARFAPVVEELQVVELPQVAAVHPALGRGMVLREHADRVDVDFGAHGVRTLLRSYVTLEGA